MVDDQPNEALGQLSSESGRNQQIYAPGHELLYTEMQIDLVLSTHRLQLLLERVERRSNAKRYSDALPWLGVFLAVLFPLLVVPDFITFLGVPGSVWQGAAFFGAIATALVIIRTLALAWTQRKERALTIPELIQELITEMRPHEVHSRQQRQP